MIHCSCVKCSNGVSVCIRLNRMNLKKQIIFSIILKLLNKLVLVNCNVNGANAFIV